MFDESAEDAILGINLNYEEVSIEKTYRGDIKRQVGTQTITSLQYMSGSVDKALAKKYYIDKTSSKRKDVVSSTNSNDNF